MVGIVLVSHSQKAAEGAVELAKMMAHDAKIAAAGGLDDGGLGTSYEKIAKAIEEVYSDDGVALIMDMGSAVMTAEMVLEDMEDKKVKMLDCPFVEGAIVGALSAMMGTPLEDLQAVVDETRQNRKLESGC